MIVDSALEIPILTTEIILKYAEFGNHIQKYKPSFKSELNRYVINKVYILILTPQVSQFNWNLIRKYDRFINSYSQLTQMLINPLYDNLAKRVFTEKHGFIEFTNLMLDNLKGNQDYMIRSYVDIFDQFYLNTEMNSDEYTVKRTEILQIVDKHLTVYAKDSNLRISPSFKLLTKDIKNWHEFHFEVKYKFKLITNDDDFNSSHAKFFVENAFASKNVLKYVLEMRRWNDTKPEEYIFNLTEEPKFVLSVIQIIEKEFCKNFDLDKFSENNQDRALEACTFIAELYNFDLYSMVDYKSCIQKVIAVTEKNPSMFALKCFENIAIRNIKQKDDVSLKKFRNTTYIALIALIKSNKMSKANEEVDSKDSKHQHGTGKSLENSKKKKKRR